ncbi:hypothetical protein [Vampirovibrio sp.]
MCVWSVNVVQVFQTECSDGWVVTRLGVATGFQNRLERFIGID